MCMRQCRVRRAGAADRQVPVRTCEYARARAWRKRPRLPVSTGETARPQRQRAASAFDAKRGCPLQQGAPSVHAGLPPAGRVSPGCQHNFGHIIAPTLRRLFTHRSLGTRRAQRRRSGPRAGLLAGRAVRPAHGHTLSDGEAVAQPLRLRTGGSAWGKKRAAHESVTAWYARACASPKSSFAAGRWWIGGCAPGGTGLRQRRQARETPPVAAYACLRFIGA